MNKKIITSFVLLVLLFAPMAHAQVVDQTVTQQLYLKALQQVIDLLVKEVAQLEAQLADLNSRVPSTSTPAQPDQKGDVPNATSTFTPSQILQNLQNSPSVVQTVSSTPSVTDSQGVTIPPGAAQPIAKANPCPNTANFNVWWQDPCTGVIGVIGSSTSPLTYDYPGKPDPNTRQFSDIQRQVNQLVESCLVLGYAYPSPSQVTISNNNGSLMLSMNPNMTDFINQTFPNNTNLPHQFPAQCKTGADPAGTTIQ